MKRFDGKRLERPARKNGASKGELASLEADHHALCEAVKNNQEVFSDALKMADVWITILQRVCNDVAFGRVKIAANGTASLYDPHIDLDAYFAEYWACQGFIEFCKGLFALEDRSLLVVDSDTLVFGG